MSKTVLILFAACVGLSLLSLHLVKQMRAGQATITELQARIDTLQRQQQATPAPQPQAMEPTPYPSPQPEPVALPPPAKEVTRAVAVRPAEPLAAEANVTVPSREERMRMMREARERQRQLMQDPEYREALRVQHRSNMSRQYPGLAQELGLTSEQTEQLFNLLAEQQLRGTESLEPMWDAEGDPTVLQQRREKMQQQWAETQRKNEAELAAQLGQDKLQAWKEYQSTLGARHQAEQYRASLASQGVPLSDEANRAFVKALAEAQKAEMQEYTNQARVVAGVSPARGGLAWASHAPTPEIYERQLEFAKKRNQRVLDALSPYITYEQREAIEREHDAQIKMQEAQMRIMRAQSKNDGSHGIIINAPPAQQ